MTLQHHYLKSIKDGQRRLFNNKTGLYTNKHSRVFAVGDVKDKILDKQLLQQVWMYGALVEKHLSHK